MVSADCCRRFNRTTKHCGSHFSKDGILKPKVLGVWHDNNTRNCVPSRSIGNPHSSIAPRGGVTSYHPHSKPIAECSDDMLHEQHYAWLQKHREQREKHLHPIYHALVRRDKAIAKAEEVQKQRETTTDLMTRATLGQPDFSSGVKAKLCNAKMAVKSTRAFNNLKGIDRVADADKQNKAALRRVQSAPILEHKVATPRHRARHLRSWKGTDRRQNWTQIDLGLKHTTPGLAQEEEWELHNSPRYRARGA